MYTCRGAPGEWTAQYHLHGPVCVCLWQCTRKPNPNNADEQTGNEKCHPSATRLWRCARSLLRHAHYDPYRSDISPISCLEPLRFSRVSWPMAFSYED